MIIWRHTAAAAAVAAAASRPAWSEVRRASRAGAPPTGPVGTPLLLPCLCRCMWLYDYICILIYYIIANKGIYLLRKSDFCLKRVSCLLRKYVTCPGKVEYLLRKYAFSFEECNCSKKLLHLPRK